MYMVAAGERGASIDGGVCGGVDEAFVCGCGAAPAAAAALNLTGADQGSDSSIGSGVRASQQLGEGPKRGEGNEEAGMRAIMRRSNPTDVRGSRLAEAIDRSGVSARGKTGIRA